MMGGRFLESVARQPELAPMLQTRMFIIAGLLVYEHYLVRPDDLTRVNMAFMTMNSVVSVLYFGFTLADLLVLGN